MDPREVNPTSPDITGPDPFSPNPISDVPAGRVALDALDDGIRALLLRRVVVSKQVQALRRGGGEPGIQHARENQVIGRYVDALGDPGADIALAILQLCRGRLG